MRAIHFVTNIKLNAFLSTLATGLMISGQGGNIELNVGNLTISNAGEIKSLTRGLLIGLTESSSYVTL